MSHTSEICELHHEVIGHGPPLVLLAGFGSDLLSWSFQREAFAARHKVVLLDNRGVGRSPTPAGPYSARMMADDVIALLDRLHLGKVHLLGHSMGGGIAQELAINYPERVQRMVLVSTFSKDHPTVIPVLEAWIESWDGELDEKTMAEQVLPKLYTEGFFSNPNRLKATLGFLRAHPYRPRVEGLRGQLAAVRQHDTHDRLPSVKAPTLVLAGDQDRLTPLSLTRTVADQIPNARFTIIPKSAHVPMLEQADLFADLVLDFLAGR